jgi:hypothetical protein
VAVELESSSLVDKLAQSFKSTRRETLAELQKKALEVEKTDDVHFLK